MDINIGDYKNIVFFDTETTGFDGEKNRIIELAAILVNAEGTKEMDEFIRLPEGQRIPEEIVELTHITDEMLLSQGKPEEEVMGMFGEMISGDKTLLVAHNAQFDLNFVGWTAARLRKEHPEWIRDIAKADYLDTLTIYKDRRPYPHKLVNAIEEYGLADRVQNSHRAVDDCKALMEVAIAMQKERPDLSKYVNIFGYNPKYGPSGSKYKKVRYLPHGSRPYMALPEQILPVLAKAYVGS